MENIITSAHIQSQVLKNFLPNNNNKKKLQRSKVFVMLNLNPDLVRMKIIGRPLKLVDYRH